MIKKIIAIPVKIVLCVIGWLLNISINVMAFIGSILLTVLVTCIVHSILTCRWTSMFIAIVMSAGILLILFLTVGLHEFIKSLLLK